MSLNIEGIWKAIREGGDVVAVIFDEIEKFYTDLLTFLREELL